MASKERVTLLQKQILEQGLGCALLFYSRDIFYYTGTAQPSYLAVFPDDAILFVRSGYEFALEEAFFDRAKIREERQLNGIAREVMRRMRLDEKQVATEMDLMNLGHYASLTKAFPAVEFVNVSPLVLAQRMVKDEGEIEKMRQACRAVHRGHEAAVDLLQKKKDVTELELAAAVENAHRLAGHEGIFFIRQPDFFMSRGPIGSGANLMKISGVVYTITGIGLSAAVPAGPSQKRILPGETIVIDIPTLVNGYHADQSRTYLIGRADDTVRSMYRDLKAIANGLIERITAGVACSEVYRMAAGLAADLGCESRFQSFGKGRHSRLIGHGIGLELNEPPVPSQYDSSVVGENYVIALDLHMMDEKAGVVKLEDMILVRSAGNEILTETPRDLFEV
jgi:Xaa-Pro aminopeptidase